MIFIVLNYFILNFLIISSLGTLNHFLYAWFGKLKILKLFFASSESVFEHMKLVLYPSILGMIFSMIFFNYNNIIFSCSVGLLVSLFLIPVLYYISLFVFKKNVGFINILIFFVSVYLGCISNIFIIKNSISYNLNLVGIIIYLIMIIYFAYYSFYPKKYGIYKEPLKKNSTY